MEDRLCKFHSLGQNNSLLIGRGSFVTWKVVKGRTAVEDRDFQKKKRLEVVWTYRKGDSAAR